MESATISIDQIIIGIIAGSLIMVSLALALIAYFGVSRKRILQVKNQQQELTIKYQSDLIQNNITTQEQERQRIAADLHDDIGSKLNVIKLYTHQLEKNHLSKDKKNQLIQDMQHTLQTTIETTRSISHRLIPPTLENFGLIAALEELQEDINQSNSIVVELTQKGAYNLTDKNIELNLFRIIQELIQNSIKHGGNKIDIKIIGNELDLIIQYADDGPGYDPMNIATQKGLGHQNILNRTDIIAAEFTNLSSIGGGAKYYIHCVNGKL